MARFLPFLALAAVCPAGVPYTLIDDYQAGPYTKTFTGTGQDVHQVTGLDTGHSAFGDRATFFQVVSNPGHVPVTMVVGGGLATVFTPPGQNDGIHTIFEMDLGLSTPVVLDLSHDKEVWVDLQVKKPDGRFADQWSLYVWDENGREGVNDGWLSRQGGIRFPFSGFIGNADFSKIKYLRFEQHFDSPGYPESYTVTRIYTVTTGVTEVAPSAFSVTTGKLSAGNVASLAKQDNNALVVCRFIVPNQSVPPVSVQFDGALPFTPSGFWLRSVASMGSAGLFQATYDLWDWGAGAYDDATSATIGTSPVKCEVTPTQDFHRFIRADGAVRARARIVSAGPAAVFGWCANFDQLVWEAAQP